MMLLRAPKNRATAALTHLALSVLVIGSIALFAFVQWYPAGLHLAAKLDKLLYIMLSVDIVAGPLLTLILYRRGKKGLNFDLATIAVLQLAFLGYGLNTLWQNRPVFLVGSQEEFALIFATGLDPAAMERAEKERWPRFGGSGPWLAAVDLSGRVARDEFLSSIERGTPGPLAATSLYVQYDNLRKAITESAKPLDSQLLQDAGTQGSALRSHRLMSSQTDKTMILLDATSGEPLRVMLREP
jgi:hypothetical protein